MDPLFYIILGAALIAGLVFVRSNIFGFAGQKASDYEAHSGEQFDLRKHLNGPIACEGVLYGPTGRVVSRFVGDFDASWNGNSGIMKERFEYDSGKIQLREWALKVGNDGKIRATAADLVGAGTGEQMGNAVNLRYRIRLEEDAGGHVLNVTDWMYLAPNGTIVNRSQFRKYGLKVAELVATMRRVEPA